MLSKFILLALLSFTSTVSLVIADTSCFRNPALQRAKWSVCEGNKIDINAVNVSALFNIRTGRHALFKGDQVQFCISGIARGLQRPVMALQNSVHGSLRIKLGNILDEQLNNAFCDINVDGCADYTPSCPPNGPAMVPNQDFCYCSSLQVPTWAPEVDEVMVTWKILAVQERPSSCEKDYSIQELEAKGKEVLACLQIPAMVRNANKKPKKRIG